MFVSLHTGLIFLIISSLFILHASALEENGVIEMPFTENPPNIDGKWTSVTEWKDSTQVVMRGGDSLAYLHVMHDRDNIYFMIDFVTDQINTDKLKAAILCFDTDSDGDSSFDVNDYCFATLREYGNYAYSVDIQGALKELSSKTIFKGASSFSSINSPNEGGRDHNMYEMSIPLSFLHKANSYGFFAEVLNGQGIFDGQFVENSIGATWPQNLKYTATARILNSITTWGTIKASAETITSPPVPFISVSTKSI